jgi:hypothetical protein
MKIYRMGSKEGRNSEIRETEKGFEIDVYDQDRFIKTVDLRGHNIYYAKSVAENYLAGIINYSDDEQG